MDCLLTGVILLHLMALHGLRCNILVCAYRVKSALLDKIRLTIQENHAVRLCKLLTVTLVKHQTLASLVSDLKIGACVLKVVALVDLGGRFASTSFLRPSCLLNLVEYVLESI